MGKIFSKSLVPDLIDLTHLEMKSLYDTKMKLIIKLQMFCFHDDPVSHLFYPFSFLSLSPSRFSLSQKHLSTTWHCTPDVGDAEVKRQRYLTVTHSVPLYPNHHHHQHLHHNSNTLLNSSVPLLPPSPHHPPPIMLHRMCFFSPSILHPCILTLQEKLRGHLKQRMKKK